ncbi:MAG: ABC transporter permease [Gemmatimonadota bacterium]
MLASWIQDVRYAVRSLRKSPGFTIIALLTIALGIGANTVMFSVVYGVLLRPLRYPHPDRLVAPVETYRGQRSGFGVTYLQYQFLEENTSGFRSLAATTPVGFNLFAGDRADRVDGLRVSENYFDVLGVSPALGRAFTADEDQPGGAPVAILSHGLWVRRFGSDPGVVGRSVLLDGEPYTVVGVMPAGFEAIPAVDVWSTIAQVGRTIGGGQNLELLARLAPGTSLEQARLRMQGTTAAFHERFPRSFPPEAGLDLMRYQDLVVSNVKDDVGILFGAIAFVLLIACANVANLVLGRTTGRLREVAVRVALGATRPRLVRLLLTESVVLAVAGGALGLLAAYWGLQALLTLAPAHVGTISDRLNLPRTGDIHLDAWAVAFTFGLALVTGVLFGLLPAWRAARADLQDTLKEGGGRATASAHRGRARGALVVAEVTLSLVLMVGAGLLLETFANLMRTDPGFRSDHLLTAEIWLTGSHYDSTAAISGFYRQLDERLQALPGVQSAAVVEAGLPLERGGNMPVAVEGVEGRTSVEYRTVTPGYLNVLGVPLLQGRILSEADAGDAEPVAVVNEAFVRRYLPDVDPVGRTVTFSGVQRRIVGVVGSLRSYIGATPRPGVFIPSAQTPAGLTRIFASWFPTHVVIRTATEPRTQTRALVQAIHDADPLVPVGQVRTMDEVLSDSLAFQQFAMLLLAVFAALALGLAAVGIYGVMSYMVAQRTHEVGLRMALGALPGDVVGRLVGRGMLLVGLGVVAGVAGAAALTRLLQSQLYGIRPTDPVTFAMATGVLALIALAACLVPALRATRVDPIEALRSE